MTDEDDCKPPLALRDRYGTHGVVRRDKTGGDRTPIMMKWVVYEGIGQWLYSEICAEFGWRYLAPVTPHATVAALVEALEGLMDVQTFATGWDNGVTDATGTMNEGDNWHGLAMDRARAALTLYNRGMGQ